MVEGDSHLKLHPSSILDTYKVFEHIDMLSIDIMLQPYTVIHILLGSDFGVLGHLWSQNDVFMSWLRLTAASNCFPHPCVCMLTRPPVRGGRLADQVYRDLSCPPPT